MWGEVAVGADARPLNAPVHFFRENMYMNILTIMAD